MEEVSRPRLSLCFRQKAQTVNAFLEYWNVIWTKSWFGVTPNAQKKKTKQTNDIGKLGYYVWDIDDQCLTAVSKWVHIQWRAG